MNERRLNTGVDEHVSVEWALRAEHFATDFASVWRRRRHRHQIVRPDVLRKVVVARQQLVTDGTRERLIAVLSGSRKYLHAVQKNGHRPSFGDSRHEFIRQITSRNIDMNTQKTLKITVTTL